MQDGHYFLDIFNQEEVRLNALCKDVEADISTAGIPDEGLYSVDNLPNNQLSISLKDSFNWRYQTRQSVAYYQAGVGVLYSSCCLN